MEKILICRPLRDKILATGLNIADKQIKVKTLKGQLPLSIENFWLRYIPNFPPGSISKLVEMIHKTRLDYRSVPIVLSGGDALAHDIRVRVMI